MKYPGFCVSGVFSVCGRKYARPEWGAMSLTAGVNRRIEASLTLQSPQRGVTKRWELRPVGALRLEDTTFRRLKPAVIDISPLQGDATFWQTLPCVSLVPSGEKTCKFVATFSFFFNFMLKSRVYEIPTPLCMRKVR